MDGRTAIDGLDQAAGLLGAARRIVVFSGAGISTDSRIIL
jgi:NAD-dependent SIR2 family protein deacetylase